MGWHRLVMLRQQKPIYANRQQFGKQFYRQIIAIANKNELRLGEFFSCVFHKPDKPLIQQRLSEKLRTDSSIELNFRKFVYDFFKNGFCH